jgi:hypothetical protein
MLNIARLSGLADTFRNAGITGAIRDLLPEIPGCADSPARGLGTRSAV